ncbi:hypothetical protein P7C70_g4694, partial [Phenoliferia sp. Uapishka_3]
MPYWLELFGDTVDSTGAIALSSGRDSLITSILSAGTFCGALLAYPVGDFAGRRYGICLYLVIFVIGVALQTAGTTLTPFVIGRVFAGLGVGGTSCLVPMYQSECAPKVRLHSVSLSRISRKTQASVHSQWIRGAVVAGYQWMITIGLLIAGVVVNATKDFNSASCYRIPIGLQFIWAAILATGLILLPESPRYLIMKGRDDQAMRALSRILSAPEDSPEVNQEFAEIAANLHHERAIGATSYLDCFRNGPGRNGLRMWTGIGIQALQQLSGINFIFYYGTQFFKNSGIDNPFLISIATNVVNVGMTLPGIWAVDKFGRRFLLLLGAFGMGSAQLIVAIVGDTVSSTNLAGQKVLIAFVCIFIGFFAATWGPLAWVVTGEIYPTSTRAKAMSMSTASNYDLGRTTSFPSSSQSLVTSDPQPSSSHVPYNASTPTTRTKTVQSTGRHTHRIKPATSGNHGRINQHALHRSESITKARKKTDLAKEASKDAGPRLWKDKQRRHLPCPSLQRFVDKVMCRVRGEESKLDELRKKSFDRLGLALQEVSMRLLAMVEGRDGEDLTFPNVRLYASFLMSSDIRPFPATPDTILLFLIRASHTIAGCRLSEFFSNSSIMNWPTLQSQRDLLNMYEEIEKFRCLTYDTIHVVAPTLSLPLAAALELFGSSLTNERFERCEWKEVLEALSIPFSPKALPYSSKALPRPFLSFQSASTTVTPCAVLLPVFGADTTSPKLTCRPIFGAVGASSEAMQQPADQPRPSSPHTSWSTAPLHKTPFFSSPHAVSATFPTSKSADPLCTQLDTPDATAHYAEQTLEPPTGIRDRNGEDAETFPGATDSPQYLNVELSFPEGKSLHSNSAFLSAASPYYKTLFASGFSETVIKPASKKIASTQAMALSSAKRKRPPVTEEDSDTEVELSRNSLPTSTFRIEITETSIVTYREVLRWIHTGDITFASLSSSRPGGGSTPSGKPSLRAKPILPLVTPASPKSVYRLSDFLELTQLKSLALASIVEQVGVANVAHELMSEVSALYAPVQDALVRYTANNWEKVKESEGWKLLEKRYEEGDPELSASFPRMFMRLTRLLKGTK